MGALKPLLPYGSGSVIQAVVRSLKASPVDCVIVVLGHRSEEIAAHLDGEDVECVVNPRYQQGMLASVQAGAAAAPADAEWLLVALGDQPSLQPSTVTLLMAAARAEESEAPGIVVPSYGGRRGHPLLIHASFRDEIAELDPAVGLRELMRRHPTAVRHVVAEDDRVLSDLDTPDDYERELSRAK